MYRIGLFLSLIVLVSAGRHDHYAGNSVYGVKLRDYTDNGILQDLQVDFDVDVWSYGTADRNALLMLTPENKEAVLNKLDQAGLEYYMDMENVVEFLEKGDAELEAWRQTKARNGRLVPFENYPRYAEINEYLRRIAQDYPDLVTLVNGGQSWEERDILYLKISTTNFTDTTKPIYFMNAMLHAREWVTTPVTLFSIYRLVENLRSQDSDLLEDIDWIIMPLVNPDGYEWTHTNFRMWRRTRSFRPEVSETCFGVDGNRNFDVNWNTTRGISQNPCNDQFIGPEPFSEPETRAIRDVLAEYGDRTQLHMDIHSHGNWILFGYGNHSLPSNAVQLFQVGAAMGATIDALKLPAAGFYVVGNSAMALYETSGSAQDYGQVAVGESGLAYTLELPGYGYAFQVPPQFIEQINFETWEGIAVSARLSRSLWRARLANQG